MAGNVVVWELFEETTSQLRVGGMGGVFGFDYSSLPLILAVYQVPESEWYVTLRKLSAIYAIALPIWNKPKDNKK